MTNLARTRPFSALRPEAGPPGTSGSSSVDMGEEVLCWGVFRIEAAGTGLTGRCCPAVPRASASFSALTPVAFSFQQPQRCRGLPL